MKSFRHLQYFILSVVLVFVTCSDDSTTPDQPPTPNAPSFVLAWGNYGSGDGEFFDIQGIACDADGNVYVIDRGNHRIQKFDADGIFLTKWGSYGRGEGQFWWPHGISIGPGGNVYVTDLYIPRVQVFDTNGTFLTQWGDWGCEDGEFGSGSCDIACGTDGNVYVTDHSCLNRIQKFDAGATFLTNLYRGVAPDTLIGTLDRITRNANGDLYVTDHGGGVLKFDADGTFLTKWGSGGTDDWQFTELRGIACDADGNVYVSDLAGYRIQMFGANGRFLTKWGGPGTGDGQFSAGSFRSGPGPIACDADGNIYVADWGPHRIQKFRLLVTPNQ